MKKPHIKLFMHEGDLLGLIVLMPSGVIFSNQTGGTMCAHPDAEGIYVPLYLTGGRWPPVDQLTDVWNRHWGRYDGKLARKLIEHLGFKHILEAVKDEEKILPAWVDLQGWGEAWVPVRIKELKADEPHGELLKDFSGHYAILTYVNSD